MPGVILKSIYDIENMFADDDLDDPEALTWHATVTALIEVLEQSPFIGIYSVFMMSIHTDLLDFREYEDFLIRSLDGNYYFRIRMVNKDDPKLDIVMLLWRIKSELISLNIEWPSDIIKFSMIEDPEHSNLYFIGD